MGHVQAAEVQPPPAYMYDFPDTTLWEVQHSLELQFSRGLKVSPQSPAYCSQLMLGRHAARQALMMLACLWMGGMSARHDTLHSYCHHGIWGVRLMPDVLTTLGSGHGICGITAGGDVHVFPALHAFAWPSEYSTVI